MELVRKGVSFLIVALVLVISSVTYAQEIDLPNYVTLKGHQGNVSSMAFSPNNDVIATGDTYGSVKVWDVKTGNLIHETEGHKNNVYQVSFSPNGELVATAGSDQTIKLWDIETGALVRTLQGHTSSVNDIVFDGAGKTIFSVSEDKTLKSWDVATGTMLYDIDFSASAKSVSYNIVYKTVAVGLSDGSVHIKKDSDGSYVKSISNVINSSITQLQYSPDGKYLVVASKNNTIPRIFMITSDSEYTQKELSQDSFSTYYGWEAFEISSEQSFIAVTDNHGIYLFDFETGSVVNEFSDSGIYDIAFSENMKMFANVSFSNIKLRDATNLPLNSQRLSGIELYPSDVSIYEGQTTPLQVIATYSDGSTNVLNNKDVIWKVKDSNTAILNKEDYTIFGRTKGVTTVTATYNGFAADMQVTVKPEDETIDLSETNLNDIVFNGKQYVTVGNQGVIMTSQDGHNWKIAKSNTKNNLNAVVWIQDQFVLVGDKGTILSSTDGVIWVKEKLPTTSLLEEVISANREIVAINNLNELFPLQLSNKVHPMKENVDKNKTWEVKFNAALDSASLDNIRIIDQDSNIVEGLTINVKENNPNIVTIAAPKNGYENGVYRLEVKGVSSQSGKELKNTVVMSFELE